MLVKSANKIEIVTNTGRPHQQHLHSVQVLFCISVLWRGASFVLVHANDFKFIDPLHLRKRLVFFWNLSKNEFKQCDFDGWHMKEHRYKVIKLHVSIPDPY